MPHFPITSLALVLAALLGVVAGIVLATRRGRSSTWVLALAGGIPCLVGAVEVAAKQDVWFNGWVVSGLNVLLGAVPPTMLFFVALSLAVLMGSLLRAAIGATRKTSSASVRKGHD